MTHRCIGRGKLRWALWASLSVAGCMPPSTTPMSVDVRYSADAAPVPQAEALSSARIGVARFADKRPHASNDLHAASYVAHDASYDLGVSWHGRTFAATADVVQGLLIEELRHAGLTAEPIDSVVGPGDTAAAREAGEREHVDVVLGGSLREMVNGNVAIDGLLVDVAGGRTLMKAPFSASHSLRAGDQPAQDRVDEVMNQGFKPVAHQMVSSVARQLQALIAAGTTETTEEKKP
jgi:hypothetical protein